MESYLHVWKNYAVFSGRASRTEFWMFILLNIIITIAIGTVERLAGSGGLIGMLYALAVIIPSFAVGARRLHDTDRSGWLQLLALIPFVGLILIVWFAQESE